MANTAEVINFPVPEKVQQESRMADLDNGYLRLANQIQDALCVVELSGREFRVLNAIVRLTYGWSKKKTGSLTASSLTKPGWRLSTFQKRFSALLIATSSRFAGLGKHATSGSTPVWMHGLIPNRNAQNAR